MIIVYMTSHCGKIQHNRVCENYHLQPIVTLHPMEIHGLRFYIHNKKAYIINPRTKIMYDENCEKVCR